MCLMTKEKLLALVEGKQKQRTASPAKIGGVVNERYTIITKLGGGVFATVWLAYDQRAKRYISLKIPYDATNAEHEVTVLRKISSTEPNHPGFEHVLSSNEVFGFGPSENDPPIGLKCIVSDVLGPSIVAFRTAPDRVSLPVNVVKQVTLQLLFALNYLHQYCDVIHTDIQPANILLTLPDVEGAIRFHLAKSNLISGGDEMDNILPFDTSDTNHVKVKLIDFGAACWASDTNSKGIQPRDFRAPEVLLEGEWDSSVDIWNLGCLVYEMMTSKSLFNPEHKDDDNLQIEHMIQLLGPFPLDVIAVGKRSGDFFTSEGIFRKQVQFVGLTALVKYALPPDQDPQDVDLLISFLEQMLALRSSERAEALELISHPWLEKTTEEYMVRLVAAAEAPDIMMESIMT
ncbi:hypothetical protein FRB93_005791 [Tulasnella sp. JGI-2019a]|nr:hypothetical protein FRB93_005791 [Tulasnella sp. JGI-2019a]